MLRIALILSVLIACAFAGLTVYDEISALPDLSEFKALIDDNGLDTELSSAISGQWTVFAPNNSLVLAAEITVTTSPEALALTEYHLFSDDLGIAGQAYTTALLVNDLVLEETDQSTFKRINVYDGTIWINGRTRVSDGDQADLQSTNGVVHYIVDGVLIPPTADELRTIGAALNDTYPTTASMVELAGLMTQLSNASTPLTVFAPTDAAWAKLAPTQRAGLFLETTKLTELLQFHVIGETLFSVGLSNATFSTLNTVTNDQLNITVAADGGSATVNGVNIGAVDQLQRNGVVHAVDDVIIPADFEWPELTLMQVIDSVPELSTFAMLLRTHNLSAPYEIVMPINITVLAPANSAFTNLPPVVDFENMTDQEIQVFFGHHVILGQEILSTDIVNNDFVVAQTTNWLHRFNIYPTGVWVDGQARIDLNRADNMAINGVVHVIESVLIPPPPILNSTLAEIFAGSVFELGAVYAGLDLGSDDTPYTVFAPSDEAVFSSFPPGYLSAIGRNPAALATLLQHHIVEGVWHPVGILPGTELTNLNGVNLTVGITAARVVTVENVNETTYLPLRNGVVYPMLQILIPPNFTFPLPNIWEIVAESSNLVSTRDTLITATPANLAELNATTETAKHTLFAPNDAAWAAISNVTLTSQEQTDIMNFHLLVDTELTTTEMTNDHVVRNVDGTFLRFNVYNGRIYINGKVEVVPATADMEALNGVVHVVDTVIVPPTEAEQLSAYEAALATDQFSTMVDLLEDAGLVDTANSTLAAFTIFAPTNDAWEALGTEMIAALKANSTLLSAVLSYHVVAGTKFAVGLKDGVLTNVINLNLTLATAAGVTVTGAVNSAQVTQADILVSNGVIHAVDAVLLPPGFAPAGPVPTNTQSPSNSTPSNDTPSSGTPSNGTPSNGTPSTATPSSSTPTGASPSAVPPADVGAAAELAVSLLAVIACLVLAL